MGASDGKLEGRLQPAVVKAHRPANLMKMRHNDEEHTPLRLIRATVGKKDAPYRLRND